MWNFFDKQLWRNYFLKPLESTAFNLISDEVLHRIFPGVFSSFLSFFCFNNFPEFFDLIFDNITETIQNLIHYSFFYRRTDTAQKMKFPIKDFFSKCDQIRSFLKKPLMENFFFVRWDARNWMSPSSFPMLLSTF